MEIELGQIEAIFRYPVKSMGGEPLEEAALGWHGVEGDRRLAFHRLDDRGDFPWLSASRLPEMVRYTLVRRGSAKEPTHVRLPEGDELPVFGEALAAEVGRRLGSPLQMMQLGSAACSRSATVPRRRRSRSLSAMFAARW